MVDVITVRPVGSLLAILIRFQIKKQKPGECCYFLIFICLIILKKGIGRAISKPGLA